MQIPWRNLLVVTRFMAIAASAPFATVYGQATGQHHGNNDCEWDPSTGEVVCPPAATPTPAPPTNTANTRSNGGSDTHVGCHGHADAYPDAGPAAPIVIPKYVSGDWAGGRFAFRIYGDGICRSAATTPGSA